MHASTICPESNSRVDLIFANKGRQIYCISMLEDLWEDYCHFKAQSKKLPHAPPAFEARRQARAALMSFVAFLNGVLNAWCSAEAAKAGTSAGETDKLLHQCLQKRFEYLIDRAGLRRLGKPNLDFAKLRNKLVHFESDYNFEVFGQLSPEWLEDIEDEVCRWLEELERVLGYKRIPDTARILKEVMAVAERSGAYGPRNR